MIKFLSIGSGSSGNCYYLENDEAAILIDTGVGIRRLKRSMKEYGISPSKLKGILITHDHADHVKAAGHVSHEYALPVYATQLVHQGICRNYHSPKKIESDKIVFIEKDLPFTLAGFQITAFTLPHDSSENVGYCIEYGGQTFTIMTDVGAVTQNVLDYIGRSNYLVIEANYDEEMLRGGKYPKVLQDRIMSGTGHLSNHQAAQALSDTFHPDLRHVWLCHLSEENNHPELARKTVEFHLRSFGIIAGKDFQLDVLRRLIPTGPWVIDDSTSLFDEPPLTPPKEGKRPSP
ncbi:MAG: MBL fold metallo-hydrolase [Bacteroidaceae bacterium]|nr:MBL fold metallo-hydrolase [Bacteroidaceae bacterium]